MKELSIEEKAQRFDEAINKAKSKIKNDKDHVLYEDDVLEIFPELMGSEDDRIRKEIIAILKYKYGLYPKDPKYSNAPQWIAWLDKQVKMDMESYKVAEDEKREFVGDGFIKCYANFQDFKEGNTYWLEYIGDDKYNVRSDNLLGKTYHITPCQLYTIFKKQTWLEKQGEQKPVDKVDSKFKVGDWVVSPNGVYWHIDAIKNNRYEVSSTDGARADWPLNTNLYHLYTVQDVKDGDVLELDCGIGIFKDKCIDGYNIHCYCYYSNEGVLEINKNSLYDTYQSQPATKEQRDTLERAITNAGYEWDAEKKELKKIEQKSIKTCAEYYNNGRELKMPVLSKFQDKLADILMHREYDGPDETEDDIAKGRLEYELAAIRLSEELLPLAVEQKPAEWSEEDEAMLNLIKLLFNKHKNDVVFDKFETTLDDCLSWFKDIKNRVGCEVNCTTTKEWSEEDESIVTELIGIFESAVDGGYVDIPYRLIKDYIRVLKSCLPQTTWKTSEEQIDAIKDAIDYLGRDTKIVRKHLMSLYEDLKKLREG